MLNLLHRGTQIALLPGQIWKPGSDETETYRDTPRHDLVEIVEEVTRGLPWRECIRRRYGENNPWLYRIVTDPSRDLYFRLYPPEAGARVLDIGAGWGQVSLPLAKFCQVTALEPTPERLAFIQAVAVQERLAGRMHFVESDFMDVEFEAVFDVICCIGVLEWVPRFREGPPRDLQRAFLARIRAALKPGGRIVVGIENRLGLKYLLGSSDDHIGSPNIAVLDSALAGQRFRKVTGNDLRSFTYTLAEYTTLFSEAGYTRLRAYAAFPDYKVPEIITPADEHLEAALAKGMVVPAEHDGSNGVRLAPDIQEALGSHYRSLAQLGISRYFAPSYFLEAWSSAGNERGAD